jgi:hypothetical protein
MVQLEFDENLAKQLEVMYRRRDVMRRRRPISSPSTRSIPAEWTSTTYRRGEPSSKI